jgi:hypothetical protein
MASQLRTASVTSTWAAIITDLPARHISIKNKTGADVYVRKGAQVTAGFQTTLSDGESVGMSIIANANEVQISAVAAGPTAGVNFITEW